MLVDYQAFYESKYNSLKFSHKYVFSLWSSGLKYMHMHIKISYINISYFINSGIKIRNNIL